MSPIDWRMIPEQDRKLLPKDVEIRVDLGRYLGILHGSGFQVHTTVPEIYLRRLFAELCRAWIEEARRLFGDDVAREHVGELLRAAWEEVRGAQQRGEMDVRRLPKPEP